MLSKRVNTSLIAMFLCSVLGAQIWPGDANNNGKADQVDMLYVGWSFGNDGPEREIMGTEWADSGIANGEWDFTFPNGTDYSYADCDGNGVIDIEDFEAVVTNFNREHGEVAPDGYLNGEEGEAPAIMMELSSEVEHAVVFVQSQFVNFSCILTNRNLLRKIDRQV